MGKTQHPKMVKCRYPKCGKLHESNELPKDEAVQGGKNSYYHPDCYHTMQTVNETRDLFVKNINPAMTGQQIGLLVSTIYNIIFAKKIDVDFLKFAVEYFIKYKPGKLQHPFGLHYIIQNKDVLNAWNKKKEAEIKAELKQQSVNQPEESFTNIFESDFTFVPPEEDGFMSIFK